MTADLVGTQLGKYRIVSEIGRGGTGVVYRGRDPDLERDVAIKVLDTYWTRETELVKRFRREARLMAQLSHPNIATVFDVGQDNGKHYLVMEYLEGETLADIVRERAPLSPGEVLSVVCALAMALDYAHQHQMVHRDIKPANVVIGPQRQVTLTDFGIVWAPEETQMTQQGTIIGTPQYMSPEQVAGRAVDGRSDQYSLGVIAYEMLCGQVPFSVENPASMLYKIAHEQTPPIGRVSADIPASVEAVLARVLSKNPDDRYPTVTAFAAALGQAIVSNTADEQAAAALRALDETRPITTDMPSAFWKRNSTWAWVLSSIALLASIISLTLGFGSRDKLSPTETVAVKQTVTPSASRIVTVLPVTPLSEQSQPELTVTVQAFALSGDGQVDMVYIPAGEFLMGTENANSYERPAHMVYLDAFWIDKTEVTNAQFAAFAEATGHRTQAEQLGRGLNYSADGRVFVEFASWLHPTGAGSDLTGLDDYPVVVVSWEDAAAFCQWRGARLPTEAEWERAARGDDARKYPWGIEFQPEALNICDVNCPFDWRATGVDDGYAMTAPVGTFPAGASPYSLLDMAGNVREWVADWYADDYYSRSPQSNPFGPASGSRRVARGSAWNDVQLYTRTTDRYNYDPSVASNEVGFRCAQSPNVP